MTTKYERTPEELERELRMMQNPNEWPMWPQLPVKRIENSKAQIGVLLEEFPDAIKPVVWLKNLWDSETTEPEKIEYDKWTDLLEAGWVVD